jgi:hypothetical protein
MSSLFMHHIMSLQRAEDQVTDTCMDIGEVLRERVGLKGTGLGVFGMRIVMMVGIQMRNLGYLIPALGKALGRRSVSGLEVVREVLVDTVRNPGVQERVVREEGFVGMADMETT